MCVMGYEDVVDSTGRDERVGGGWIISWKMDLWLLLRDRIKGRLLSGCLYHATVGKIAIGLKWSGGGGRGRKGLLDGMQRSRL
jgi:hypothetical protein